jgi:hypothetical protein
MQARVVVLALAGLLAAVPAAWAAHSDGIDSSLLAPGLVQANEAIARLQRLVDEAAAIGTALFRVHNDFGEKRSLTEGQPECKTLWLIDLGARSRELGRAYRDAVQSARVQARRIENLTVEPTVQPLLDAETNHRVASLLARVDDLERRYPEAAAWQERYVEPVIGKCMPVLIPAPGFPDVVPPTKDYNDEPSATHPKQKLVAIIAFGGGFICPGAEPAAGVMLVVGDVCYSESESCDCKPAPVSPATVLGPDTNAGSAN